MRGRLINPYQAVFAILDPDNTTYDPDYREPIGDRAEIDYTIPCQVEPGTWYRKQFGYSGLEQDGETALILHFKHLEQLGLVNSNGSPIITIESRLKTISRQDGTLVREYVNPPGMYVVDVRDESFGLQVRGNSHRNLYFLLLSPRKRSKR